MDDEDTSVVELPVSAELEVNEPALLVDEPVLPDEVDTTPGPWVGSAPESPS